MKVLLVDPPFQIFMGFHRFYYPLGLGYIAAVLNMYGHSAKIYDAEHGTECRSQYWLEASHNYHLYLDALSKEQCPEWNNFKDMLRTYKPQLVGISVLSVKTPAALRLASICKQFDKNIIVVVGGDHPTILPHELLKSKNVDFAVRGEGEYTMLELVEYLSKEKNNFEQIEGLSYKKNGVIVSNKSRAIFNELDALPFPAVESLFYLKNYRPIDLGVIMTSRGCPYSCTYCGIANTMGRQVRVRSIGNVISEIKKLNQKYDVIYFSFRDSSFTVDRNRTIDLCNRMMGENLNIQWECSTRANLLDYDLISKMKSSGCVLIRIGIESGNEQLMQQMKRGITLDQIKQGARMLNEHNMRWSAYFMFGIPGETRKTIKDSMRLITEINPPFVTIANYSLIPGTEMYEEVKRLGLVTENIDWAQESNQNILKSYSSYIDQKEFEVLMEKVGEIVNKHNEVRSVTVKKDFRDKL
ncbi:B12-binding domain-containing radical SAM protein [Chloroflexota bacterium]